MFYGILRNRAVVVSELEMFPAMYEKNGSHVEVNGGIVCASIYGAPSILNPVLSKSSHVRLFLKWGDAVTHIIIDIIHSVLSI